MIIIFDIDNSYSLLKSSFKEKIEILISLLLIVNVLIYSKKIKKNLKLIKREFLNKFLNLLYYFSPYIF